MRHRGMIGVLVLAILAVAAGCGSSGGSGGGGAAPTVSSLKDAADTAIEAAGSTTANPNSFTLTFDQGMDLTTLSNITLVCGTLTPAITVAAGGTTGAYAIAVADAWKYALLSCTLTIPTTVKSSGGTAIAEATYTFQNPCAVGDDFNAQSISDASTTCWQILTAGGGGATTLQTWQAMSSYFSFDTVDSTLDFDFTAGDAREYAALGKTASISENGFEVELYFKNVSGLINIDGTNYDAAFLFIGDSSTEISRVYGVEIVAGQGDNKQYCVVFATTIDETEAIYYGAECNEANTGYYIKLAVSPTGVTKQYKVDGGEYQNLSTVVYSIGSLTDIPTWTGNWAFTGANRTLSLGFDDVAVGAAEGRGALDYVRATGFTVTGQY